MVSCHTQECDHKWNLSLEPLTCLFFSPMGRVLLVFPYGRLLWKVLLQKEVPAVCVTVELDWCLQPKETAIPTYASPAQMH
jgi:hypothetical protein